MNKIAFYGPASSGKTWCAEYLRLSYGYSRVAFADKLKIIASELFNVHGKDGSDRVTLQVLGLKMREILPSVWIDYILKRVAYTTEVSLWVLDDMRYSNEADALRAAGWTLIMVTAPSEVRAGRLLALYPNTPASVYYHASETEWLSIDPDYIVTSVDPEDTKKQLDNILEKSYVK